MKLQSEEKIIPEFKQRNMSYVLTTFYLRFKCARNFFHEKLSICTSIEAELATLSKNGKSVLSK